MPSNLADILIRTSRDLELPFAAAVRAADEAAKRRCLQQAADLLDGKMPSPADLRDLLGGLTWALLVLAEDADDPAAAQCWSEAAQLVDEASGLVVAPATGMRQAA